MNPLMEICLSFVELKKKSGNPYNHSELFVIFVLDISQLVTLSVHLLRSRWEVDTLWNWFLMPPCFLPVQFSSGAEVTRMHFKMFLLLLFLLWNNSLSILIAGFYTARKRLACYDLERIELLWDGSCMLELFNWIFILVGKTFYWPTSSVFRFQTALNVWCWIELFV